MNHPKLKRLLIVKKLRCVRFSQTKTGATDNNYFSSINWFSRIQFGSELRSSSVVAQLMDDCTFLKTQNN